MSSSDQHIEPGAIISGSLGKYRLREVVGKGGNGIVFSADLVESDEGNKNDFWHYPETIVELAGKKQIISRPVKIHLRKIQY